jgi:UDP-N-acetylmuramyl tripeptide synthase
MASAKCDIWAEIVRYYIDELERALSVIRVPDQILNRDKTRFCSRSMKTKKKAFIYSMGCGTKAADRKETDLNHVSLVPTINLLEQR